MNYAIEEHSNTISRIQEEYLPSITPWYIGFSGGKDSSTILKLTFLRAHLRIPVVELPPPTVMGFIPLPVSFSTIQTVSR